MNNYVGSCTDIPPQLNKPTQLELCYFTIYCTVVYIELDSCPGNC